MTIAFSNVDFSYKKNSPVLKNFSLEAKQGDNIALKGASGSGKTTLFRLLLGFERPDNGEIYFKDKELTPKQIKRIRQETAWLPQDLNLGEGLVKDVFYYPFSFNANKAKKPDRKKIFSTFEKLGLSDDIWEERFPDLSTGQRQRVGLALCHLLDKNILLLDEPTSALDENSKEKAAKLLFDNNRIVLSSSHDPWWIDRCDKIVEINPR